MTYETWLHEVRAALSEINMGIADWDEIWPFDFRREFDAGVSADDAALRANKFWWQQQRRHDCGLISPAERYERDDYVKIEIANEGTGVAEWVWMCVTGRDDQKQLVFGVLDSRPLDDCGGKIDLGSELAVSYAQVRDHRKA
ncbi:MAG: hypothetical protein LAO56_23385 [Acidobacteriia bacterium]|nr:hypothetical protein [Terriglobia bacterium]